MASDHDYTALLVGRQLMSISFNDWFAWFWTTVYSVVNATDISGKNFNILSHQFNQCGLFRYAK